MLHKLQVGKPLESVPGHIAIKCLESIDKKILGNIQREMTHQLPCKILSKTWGSERGSITS